MRDLSCSPTLRASKSSVLHVQIPQQTGLECHPGLSCSKELWGQTCQVNLSQSDRVYPQTSPIYFLKTHGAPYRPSSFLPLQAFGDLLPQYTPHINISSTCHHPGLWGDFSQSCGLDIKDLSISLLMTWWNISHGQDVRQFLQRSLHLCHHNINQNSNLGLSWSTFTLRC